MADIHIPDKAYEEGFLDDANEHASEREVRAIIDAAAPLIVAAELEQLANTFANNSKACLALGGNTFSEGRSDGLAVARDALNRRAAELRGVER